MGLKVRMGVKKDLPRRGGEARVRPAGGPNPPGVKGGRKKGVEKGNNQLREERQNQK